MTGTLPEVVRNSILVDDADLWFCLQSFVFIQRSTFLFTLLLWQPVADKAFEFAMYKNFFLFSC